MAKRAVIRVLRSGLMILARQFMRFGIQSSWFATLDTNPAVGSVLNSESQAPNRHPWDVLIHSVRLWDVRRVEFCWLGKGDFRRIRWIDPTTGTGEHCCWSLSVSLPNASGELCELRASSTRPIIDDADFAALTSLLKTFGEHFAANVPQILGPVPIAETPVEVGSHPDGKRRAA